MVVAINLRNAPWKKKGSRRPVLGGSAQTIVTRPRGVALRVLLLFYRCKLSSDSIQSVVPRSAFSFFFGCRQYASNLQCWCLPGQGKDLVNGNTGSDYGDLALNATGRQMTITLNLHRSNRRAVESLVATKTMESS